MAVWAYSFDDIIYRTDPEALWYVELWHFYTVEAIGLLTYFTIEVRMLVVVVVVVVTVAEFIASAVVASFNGVYKVLLSEKCEGSEYVRLVNGQDSSLQFCQRLGQHGTGQSLNHRDAVGSGFDVMLLKQLDIGCLIHLYLCRRNRLQRYKIISNYQ